MGAFGAALISKERYQEGYETQMLKLETLHDFNVRTEAKRCGLCGNHCQLTVNHFSDGVDILSLEIVVKEGQVWRKLKHQHFQTYMPINFSCFDYPVLSRKEAKRGTIGIPRVLNIYEDYPFWQPFLRNWAIE